MPLQVTFHHAGDHLRFEIGGERPPAGSVEEALDVWRQVVAECRARGLDRALGVSRLPGKLTTADTYEIATRLPGILGGTVRKVAFVVIGSDESLRANLFGENVALNRGANGRVFDDEARALDWLLAD